jgi:hypothetical protein
MSSSTAASGAATIRTPARVALNDHHGRFRDATNTAAVTRQSYDTELDRQEHAQALVRDRQAAVAAIDAKEAALVGDAWPPKSPPPKLKEQRAAAADDLDHARRVLATVEKKVEAARGPSDAAAIAVREMSTEIPALVNAVLLESGQEAVARLGAARAALAQAESTVDSIRAVLVERHDFRAAEKIAFAVRDLRFPARQLDPARYRRLAERLLESADAVVAE